MLHNACQVFVCGLALALAGAGCAGLAGGLGAEDACARGRARACDDLADAEMKARKATGVYTRYCDRGGAYSCYAAASELEKQSGGSLPEIAEQLVSFSQRACLRGAMAGCNRLAHFAKHYVRRCTFMLRHVPLCSGALPSGERPLPAGFEKEVARSCGIAGAVVRAGIRVPRLSGPTWEPDPGRARAFFGCACAAGSMFACAERQKVR